MMDGLRTFQYREGFYWRIYKQPSGKIEVIPMSAWDEFDYDQNRFITLKLFDTTEDAQVQRTMATLTSHKRN